MYMKQNNAKPFFTEKQFQVRTYDIDYASHVSNIVYLRWMEDLRFALLEKYFPLTKQLQAGFVPVLTRTDIHYRRAIRLFEAVHGHMWVQSVGAARFVITAQLLVNNDICADVLHEIAFVEAETGKPIRVPSEFRRIFEQAQQK